MEDGLTSLETDVANTRMIRKALKSLDGPKEGEYQPQLDAPERDRRRKLIYPRYIDDQYEIARTSGFRPSLTGS